MRKQKGFTLVELVVVVMILGILAAVAAPKLLKTSSAASENGLKQSLAVVRDAIERYAAEHAGSLPGGATIKTDLEPYLRGTFPTCPVGAKNSDVKVTTTAGAIVGGTGTECWHYNSADGQFICNVAGNLKSEPTVAYDDL
jgi:general secretion pathway protein G